MNPQPSCCGASRAAVPPSAARRRALTVTAALLGLALWWPVYRSLDPLAAWLSFGLFGLDPQSHLGEAVRFFLYDGPKVLMLLVVIVFFVGVLRSFFTPEATRRVLAGRRRGVGNVLAAGLGVLTPFCSCSAVPLFVGFVTAGVPLGVTFSFLIAAPMVNEVALALLFGLFGWRVALFYAGFGLGVAIVAGWIIGRLNLERWLQPWVRQQLSMASAAGDSPHRSWAERLGFGRSAVRDIVGKVWVWVLVGVGLGAVIHGWVPEDFMIRVMGRDVWWSVPLAVLLGVPMYTNAAGVVPVIQALTAKGAALGTALAFMMSVIALSLPEMLILRKVLTWRLLAVFVAVVAAGILGVGWLFNALI
ncbi:MAG: permease [Desulfovibrionaceae bacterium]